MTLEPDSTLGGRQGTVSVGIKFATFSQSDEIESLC